MGYNGGKRVWPQRNSGFSKSSMRFGNKMFKMAVHSVLEVGFSTLGLTKSSKRTRKKTLIKNSVVEYKTTEYRSLDNKTIVTSEKNNLFFNSSNLARFSNSKFDIGIKQFKEISSQNRITKQNIEKLTYENFAIKKKIKSKQWIRLFYKNEISRLENYRLKNENAINDLKGFIINEYIDFSAFLHSDIFEDLFSLIQKLNVNKSFWMLYPHAIIPFQLNINSLNYSIFFNRNNIQELKSPIPFIDSIVEKNFCINDSIISIIFLSCAIIIYNNDTNFAVLCYSDLQCSYKEVLIKEDDSFKNNNAVIDSFSWKYQKVDGTPDMRYKNNPQVPIVKYSNISLQTINGFRLEFLLLNQEFGRRFFETFNKIAIDS